MSPSGSGAVAGIAVAAAVAFLSSLLAGGSLGLALARPWAEADAPVSRRLSAMAGLLAVVALGLLPLSVAWSGLSAPGEALESFRRAFGPWWIPLLPAGALALARSTAPPGRSPLGRVLDWTLAAFAFAFLAGTVLAGASLEVPARAGSPPLDGNLGSALLLRTLAAVAVGGGFLLAAADGPEPGRRRLACLAAVTGLPAALLLPAAAWLWFRTAPAVLETIEASPPAALALRLAAAAGLLGALGLAAGGALSARRSALASPLAAAVVLALGFLASAGAETARAPLLAPPAALLPPGGAADGRALFAARCRGCHTVAGSRGVRRHLDGRSLDQVATVLHTLEKRRGHAPYPGPEAERPVLARWLAGLDGVVEPEGVEARDFLARGRQVMEGFCLSCHVLDGPPSRNPLRPKVRGWTQEQAYQTVGRLSRLNPGMIDYDGPDADRQALAAWLAVVGSQGQP